MSKVSENPSVSNEPAMFATGSTKPTARLGVGDQVAYMNDPEQDDWIGTIKYFTVLGGLKHAARVYFPTATGTIYLTLPLSRLRRIP